MSAFLDFLNAYAIWIYLGGAIGILFSIKMLVDARRQARTTLFTLEQEQANDRALRSIIFMVAFTLLIAGVSAINTFVAPVNPPIQSAALAQPTTLPYTPPVVLPTFTTVPTLTPQGPTEAPSPTPTKPAPAAPQATPVPVQPTTAPVVVRPTDTPVAAPAAVTYPAPVLVAPFDKESISKGFIQFRWDRGEVPAQLPSGQSYMIIVSYIDRDTKAQVVRTNCTSYSNIFTTNWIGDDQNRAIDFFSWNVVVVQLPGPNGNCRQGTPISPQSETHTFIWR